MTTRIPEYEPPDCLIVDAALKSIDALLNDCGRAAIDNTCAGLIHYVHARWEAIRAEQEVYGEAWAERHTRWEPPGTSSTGSDALPKTAPDLSCREPVPVVPDSAVETPGNGRNVSKDNPKMPKP